MTHSIANQRVAFIGGGNMASAIIGGLLRQGLAVSQIDVIEPLAEARDKLLGDYGVKALSQAGPALQRAQLVIWAVKPQAFKDAAQQACADTGGALHLSVAAGIRSDSIAAWLGSQRVVRAMPNTPALVGKGITGLFARAGVTDADKAAVHQVIATTGESVWVTQETQLDAVTALSGSGPAYVFFFLDAMQQAGSEMGLPPAQALQLAIATFAGAAELARASHESPDVLRQRVTSRGGTTHAAIAALEQGQVKQAFVRALHAARQRAKELGDEFGA
jgi:pyrroline-5-carboxylate reductase